MKFQIFNCGPATFFGPAMFYTRCLFAGTLEICKDLWDASKLVLMTFEDQPAFLITMNCGVPCRPRYRRGGLSRGPLFRIVAKIAHEGFPVLIAVAVTIKGKVAWDHIRVSLSSLAPSMGM